MIKDEMKEEEIAQELEDELNIFDQLLSLKDKTLSIRVVIPYLSEPLFVYYMILKEGEFEAPALPPNFMDFDEDKKADYLLSLSEMKVWEMIKKANKHGKVPKKYKMTKKKFLSLKKNFPEVYNEIIGVISGRVVKYMDFFMRGQQIAE